MPKGKYNCYTCARGHNVVTLDRDEGTTPFMLSCRHDRCDLPAQSRFYNIDQRTAPMVCTHEWIAPTEDEILAEIERMRPMAAELGRQLMDILPLDEESDGPQAVEHGLQVFEGHLREHIRKGGLILVVNDKAKANGMH